MSLVRKIKNALTSEDDTPFWPPNPDAKKSNPHVRVRAIRSVSDHGIEAGKEYLAMADAAEMLRVVGWAEILDRIPGGNVTERQR
jgi:hypothetical protein